MAAETKEVKEFEDKFKEVLFGKVGEISSQQRELISGIEESGKFVDLESNLPNLGITLNNKLVELQYRNELTNQRRYSDGKYGNGCRCAALAAGYYEVQKGAVHPATPRRQ